jgi:hypothetical protein
MRRFGIVLCCSAVALMAVSIVGTAQQPQKGGKGGGFGGGFGGIPKDPYLLLQRSDVKKELDLSEDQTDKLPSVVMKAIKEVLNDKQIKRLHQIELQVADTQAFVKNESLRKELKITDSQTKNIEEVLADTRKEVEEMMKEAKSGGNFKGMMEKITGINKEAKEKVMGVLTADQKKAYKQLIGEEFKFEKGFNFGKKKADTE